MLPNRETLLCRYHYDALNRLVYSTPAAQATANQFFYRKERLATEIQGVVQRSIMQHGDHLLAEHENQGGTVQSALLSTDQQRSVLSTLDATSPARSFSYTPYGHCALGGDLLGLLGFKGERPDPVTGWYLLGTGHHRPFSSVLMCFTSPDSWSPFGVGGPNAHAYCGRDPVNQEDSNGHAGVFTMLRRAISSVLPTSSMTRANRAYEAARKEFPNTSAHPSLPRSSKTSLNFPNASNESNKQVSSRLSISSESSKISSASSSYASSMSRKNSLISPREQLGPLPPLPPGVKSKTAWSYPEPAYTAQNLYEVPYNGANGLEGYSLGELNLMLSTENQILDLLTSSIARKTKNISTIINNIRGG
jgi:RHS repeat-associated protein